MGGDSLFFTTMPNNQTTFIPLTDLRIGNIVTHPQDEVIKIRSITPDIITYYLDIDKYSWTHPDFISGIPLTEEWLINFGFKKIAYYYIHPYTSNRLILVKDKSFNQFFFYISDEQDNECSKNIGYVSDLQNAFYWITGTELTLK